MISNDLAKFVEYDGLVIAYHETGSIYICNPPVTNTDFDVVVLVSDAGKYHDFLSESGWVVGGFADKKSAFTSYKKYYYNLIVTNSPSWYTKFCAATELAKAMNLTNKEDRITLFNTVLEEKDDTTSIVGVPQDSFGWSSPTLIYTTTPDTTTTTNGTSFINEIDWSTRE